MNTSNSIKTTLSTRIASILRIKIMKGDYSEGEHLNELRIANEYGVSRGPVRDAIKTLENEGFVYTPKNGRTIAQKFTKRDFVEYHEIRYYLESEAIKQIIRNAKNDKDYDRWIQELSNNINRMKEGLEIYKDEEFNQCDFLFHKSIMIKSKNRLSIKFWESISGIREAIMNVNYQYMAYRSNFYDIYKSHFEIFEGLKERDLEKAVESCRKHIDVSVEMYADIYK